MRIIRLQSAPVALGLAGFALTSLAGTIVSAETPDNVLVIGKSEDPRTLDPAITMSNNAWSVTYPAYERLVRYKVEDGQGSTEVEGELASSWEVSDDGLVWTFELEPGHAFASGDPVDAEAVRFSFDRLLELGQGPSEAFPAVDKVEAVDDDTVRFTLGEPFAPFLYTLANNGAAVIDPAVMAQEKDGDLAQEYLSGHTVGSGAYQMESWEKGQRLVMKPNPHYGGPAPSFDEVEIRMIKEASARRLQLEGGDLDIAEHLPLDQIEAIKQEPGIRVEEHPSFSVTYLYLNNQRPPLDQEKVREAISYAIDYEGIIEGILLGNATQMRGPIPQGMWGHDEDLKQFHRDLDQAEQLLDEAGVDPASVDLGYLYAQNDPNWEPIGLTVQANLADLGFDVEMQQFAYATMRDKLDKGEFDIAVGNWTPDFSDPYMFMNYWFDSSRHGLPGDRAFYTNEKVDELIREAAQVTDQEKRTELYQQAQKIVVDEAPYVYLFQRNYQLPMRDDVKGYVYNPMLLDIYNIGTMSKGDGAK